jgi:hypothetical protein
MKPQTRKKTERNLGRKLILNMKTETNTEEENGLRKQQRTR